MVLDSQCAKSDLVVFSHLRWDLGYQRPRHLISRFAKYRRVYFVEEYVHSDVKFPHLNLKKNAEGITVVVPHIPHATRHDQRDSVVKNLIDDLLAEEEIDEFCAWYYTPMALTFTRHLKPETVIYDMIDESSLLKGASPVHAELENELMKLADLVTTAGHSLFEAKQNRHSNIHPLPSGIDFQHFSLGRSIKEDPPEQAHIPHPRVGFYGDVDESFDPKLLSEIAELRPDLNFIVLCLEVKIDSMSLPQAKNIHYLGEKDYQRLPQFIASWDCAMLPLALNDSTRFISPTKTPEFLAAAKPVVSTRIYDVVRPYEERKLVHIADNAQEFCQCIDLAMIEKEKSTNWLDSVDNFLSNTSWDTTWIRMARLETSCAKIQSKVAEPYISALSIVRQSKAVDLNAVRPY